MIISKSVFNIGVGVTALCAAVFMPVAGARAAAVSEENTPIAVIDGDTVTKEELTSFAMQLEQSEGMRVSGSEGLLNEYILTRLYDEIPTTAGVSKADVSPAPTGSRSSVAQRSVLKRNLRQLVADEVEVPRSEMEIWYRENVNKYEKPERVHAYHIFMETGDDPSSSPAKVRARLEGLKGRIDGGTSFSQMAKQFSEAASGESGGEIGMITRRMPIGPLSKPMNLKLEDAFFALTPGEASDVVDTRHGMHLLYISDKETTRVPTLDDMVTSGILPGVLAQDKVTSALRQLVRDTTEKYKGEALPGGFPKAGVTTDTVAFRFDGKNFTIGDLSELFGPRFESYLERAKEDPNTLESLMGQALEDEAMVRAALDKGIGDDADTARRLKLMGLREVARKRINAIADAESVVTEEAVQSRYNELKDQLRRPEAEGFLLTIQTESNVGTGTAEIARARQTARERAEAIRGQLESMDFAAFRADLKAKNQADVEITEIARHVIGRTTDTASRIFDQAASAVRDDSGFSEVVPASGDFAIANLVKRYPGDPIPLENVRERLESIISDAGKSDARRQMVERLEAKGLVEYLPGAAEYGKEIPGAADDSGTTSTTR